MSASPEVKTAAAPFDDETDAVDVRRTFKTTEENKTEGGTVSLSDQLMIFLQDTHLRSAKWRSFGQLMNDAIICYLNGTGESVPVEKIMIESSWSSDNQLSFVMTETLFNEIDLMVSQHHTPWETKQEFYICALYEYVHNDYPVVLNLR